MLVRRSFTNLSRFHLIFTALLLVSLIPLQSVFDSGDVKAAVIPWTDSNGIGNGFYWQNGGSDKGLFGNPTLIGGNILHFSPQNFIAESVNGKSAIKSDRLQVDIIAASGTEIQSIKIREHGSYDINTAGKVSDSGAIFITNLSFYEVRSASFQLDPVMPITTSSSYGDWSGQAFVDQLGWTHLRIVLNNNLIATSQQGSYSNIEKTGFDIYIPEPATIALLLFGSSFLMHGRKTNIRTERRSFIYRRRAMNCFKSICFRMRFLFLAAVLLQILIFGQNAQALIYWTNSSGSAANFNWANGGSDANLFGSPTLVGGNTLAFSPSNFEATSIDGLTDSVTDRLEFELIAHDGLHFQTISITESGDYGIDDHGSVEVSGALTIINMNTGGTIISSSLDINPDMPVTSSDFVFDIWDASNPFNIDALNCTHIKIILQNNLQADSLPGSAAWIEKKELGNTITVHTIPEPATIGLLVLGSLVLLGKKKQNNII